MKWIDKSFRSFPFFSLLFFTLFHPFAPLSFFFLVHVAYVSSQNLSSYLDNQQSTHWGWDVKERHWENEDGCYEDGKMYVSDYFSGSWESSFDSQCLEIIRSRGGPGVATATANHRAKKNFSLYNAHFSVLVFAWAPSRNTRGSRRRSRGLVRRSTTTKTTRRLWREMRARRKLDGKVMGGDGDNVCSGTGEIHRYTNTNNKLHCGISRHLDCML